MVQSSAWVCTNYRSENQSKHTSQPNTTEVLSLPSWMKPSSAASSRQSQAHSRWAWWTRQMTRRLPWTHRQMLTSHVRSLGPAQKGLLGPQSFCFFGLGGSCSIFYRFVCSQGSRCSFCLFGFLSFLVSGLLILLSGNPSLFLFLLLFLDPLSCLFLLLSSFVQSCHRRSPRVSLFQAAICDSLQRSDPCSVMVHSESDLFHRRLPDNQRFQKHAKCLTWHWHYPKTKSILVDGFSVSNWCQPWLSSTSQPLSVEIVLCFAMAQINGHMSSMPQSSNRLHWIRVCKHGHLQVT